ncbi:MAG: aldo/keto reductase [Acidobacteria bacterium]|nr:MAG: aldo/keto reductase [Acidobacteriota bacterium]
MRPMRRIPERSSPPEHPARRAVLRRLAALLAWAGLPSRLRAAPPASGSLPRRALGRTGVELPVLGLGGFHVGKAPTEKDARRLVETAFSEGIRFFDNAESYQKGRAERWMGAALEGIRDQVFLMTKTFDLAKRDAEGAKRHLEGSLERLRTDHLDLWQLHSVRSVADVERAFRKGGAMEYILEQKRLGVVRFVGVTGHKDPEANLRALAFWDEGWRFDVMQMPLNPIDYHQKSFQRRVLPELVRRGIGVLAMKTNAGGALASRGVCTVEESLRYVLALPVSVVISGMETPEQVRRNAAIVRESAPMSESERRALLERIAPRAGLELEWYKS